MLAGKATDFFDPFNNARDFAVGPQKGLRSLVKTTPHLRRRSARSVPNESRESLT